MSEHSFTLTVPIPASWFTEGELREVCERYRNWIAAYGVGKADNPDLDAIIQAVKGARR